MQDENEQFIDKDLMDEVEINENFDDDLLEVNRFDITSYPADYTLSTVYAAIENKNQIIFPDFQRSYVWGNSRVRQSRLIESFLLGLPVPQVFLYKRNEDNKLLVIDGLQRLTTIIKFFNDEFKLTGIQDRWNGKKFSELEQEDKDHLEGQPIRAIIIRQMAPQEGSDSMFHIFERLNTGGVSLNPMEIRKAVWWGDFYNYLTELNENSSWRKIIAKQDVSSRLYDIEWVLRFLAIYDSGENYVAPMKNFLNDFMIKGAAGKVDTTKFKSVFDEASQLIDSQLGERPFHYPKTRLNLSIMDVTMVAIARANDKTNLKSKFESLLNDEQFKRLNSEKDTARTEVLKDRLEVAKKYFV